MLSSAVNVSAMADERIKNVNAEMSYDEETKTYSIIPEVQGTELNDPDVQRLVQTAVDDAIGGAVPSGDIEVQIPSELYIVPDVLSTNEELNLKVNTYNSYDKAVITYVYGDEKETIDWGTISNWIVFENGEGYLSEQLIREYVMSIGQKYNTIYYNRSFNTSLGTTIQFGESENNYGYLVDEEGEYQQLLAENPDYPELVNNLPKKMYSGKMSSVRKGYFFCYELPDRQADGSWAEEGLFRWYVVDSETKAVCEDVYEIWKAVRCKKEESRVFNESEEQFNEFRKAIESYIKKNYMRAIQAPAGRKIKLVTWMQMI